MRGCALNDTCSIVLPVSEQIQSIIAARPNKQVPPGCTHEEPVRLFGRSGLKPKLLVEGLPARVLSTQGHLRCSAGRTRQQPCQSASLCNWRKRGGQAQAIGVTKIRHLVDASASGLSVERLD